MKTAAIARARADRKQIAEFDRAPLAGELWAIAGEAMRKAIADPDSIRLADDGIAPLERETAVLIFEAMCIGYWPEIVKAYRRGSGGEVTPDELDTLLDIQPEQIPALMDSIKLAALRETLHEIAWGVATRIFVQARKAVALMSVQ
jgi:hypothetical protein